MKIFKNRKLQLKILKGLALGNRGQGLVEFILMIVIIIILVLGLAFQFNDAFRVYAQNYFGEYLACLIETGEIPSLGATGSTGICNAQFAEFSIENGRPLVGDGIQPGGGLVGGGLSGENSSNENASSFTASGGTRGANSSYGSGSSRNSRFKVGRRGKKGSGDGEGGSSGRRKVKKNQNGVTDYGDINNEGDRVIVIKRRRYGSIGTYDADEDEQQKEREKPIKANTEAMRKGGAKEKVMIKIDKKKKKSDIEEFDDEIGFGDFFRYLIIIAIIIALVVFFGGQAMRITKSMEAS